MGIYIKGMEMPGSCGECWFCHAVGNDKWHCRLTDKSFSSWEVGWGARNNKGENGQHPYVRRLDCPLVPVADVREVVVCGECEFWNRERISCEGLARCNTGESGIRYRNRSDFCSRGKKREG